MVTTILTAHASPKPGYTTDISIFGTRSSAQLAQQQPPNVAPVYPTVHPLDVATQCPDLLAGLDVTIASTPSLSRDPPKQADVSAQ
eukprot:1676007-Ditylum_brightwellii.AAC.1